MKKYLLALVLLVTVAAHAEPTGFVLLGDWGHGNADQIRVANGMKHFCATGRCDFVLSLGDNFYPSGVQSTSDVYWQHRFHQIYDPLNLKFYVTLGNHDYRGDVQAQVDYSKVSPLWVLPARYYQFTRGDVAFFSLDTNDFGAAQQAWLKAGLAASTAKWKVVFGHHPIYSYGQHGDTSRLVRGLLPLLKGKAQFYLAGHDHDKQWLKPEGGVHFVVSGTGGETRRVRSGSRTQWASATLGFGHLEIDGDQATLRFLDESGAVQYEARVQP